MNENKEQKLSLDKETILEINNEGYLNEEELKNIEGGCKLMTCPDNMGETCHLH